MRRTAPDTPGTKPVAGGCAAPECPGQLGAPGTYGGPRARRRTSSMPAAVFSFLSFFLFSVLRAALAILRQWLCGAEFLCPSIYVFIWSDIFQFSPMFVFSSIHFQCLYRPDAQCSCFLPFIFNAYTDQTLNLSISIYLENTDRPTYAEHRPANGPREVRNHSE